MKACHGGTHSWEFKACLSYIGPCLRETQKEIKLKTNNNKKTGVGQRILSFQNQVRELKPFKACVSQWPC